MKAKDIPIEREYYRQERFKAMRQKRRWAAAIGGEAGYDGEFLWFRNDSGIVIVCDDQLRSRGKCYPLWDREYCRYMNVRSCEFSIRRTIVAAYGVIGNWGTYGPQRAAWDIGEFAGIDFRRTIPRIHLMYRCRTDTWYDFDNLQRLAGYESSHTAYYSKEELPVRCYMCGGVLASRYSPLTQTDRYGKWFMVGRDKRPFIYNENKEPVCSVACWRSWQKLHYRRLEQWQRQEKAQKLERKQIILCKKLMVRTRKSLRQNNLDALQSLSEEFAQVATLQA